MSTGTLSKPLRLENDRKGRTEKKVNGSSLFEKLPDEIIEQILHICEPNTFASLILLNTTWRRVSQQAYLYAHHLSQCPSYSASHPPIANPLTEDQLPVLRKVFALEVKRNLFDAYLRPRETVINLVSTSISSSAAFPGGEAFHFAFSPKGHYVLAYSSSRIYVINTAEKDLAVKRELKILRRPASLTILDDGSLLAVLSTDHQVDVYDLKESPPKHIHALALDHAPRTISLAPTGSVLAAGYDAGIEVYSLAAKASLTDRRAVKCDAADSLSFSNDGTQLLGTTLQSKNPSTVILTAPYFDPGDCSPEESVSYLWTTSILFPHSSRDCSHAVLLPSPMDDEASWAFTYDRVFETFRAVRIDDLRNGTTYFTGPQPDLASGSKLLPSTLPATTEEGELVAAGFRGKEIWLYGVPENLNPPADSSQSTINGIANDIGSPSESLGRSNSAPSVRSHTWPRDPNSNRIPQWHLLSDKSRNRVVEGRNINTLQGVTALKWVSGISRSASDERLVVVAPGVVGQLSEADEDGVAPVDGGRFSLLDFNYGIMNGEKCSLTIEVGENEPEVLEEEHRDMETEVAIVRRRTVAQKGERSDILRSATIMAGQASRTPGRGSTYPPLSTAAAMPAIPRIHLRTNEEQPETASIASVDEAQEALDAPYAHGSPRSAPTLRRAATAAAINRHLHPPRIRNQEQVQFRRADGREEHPHESDADNWVPPPPPYSREPLAPLPEHLRNAVLAGSIPATNNTNLYRSSTQRSSGSTDSTIINSLHRARTTYVPAGEPARRPSLALHRTSSDPTILSSADSHDANGPPTRMVANTFDDLYDVSPVESPALEPARPVVSATAIPRIPDIPNLPYSITRRPVQSSTPAQIAQTSAPSHPSHPESLEPEQNTSRSNRWANSGVSAPWECVLPPSAPFEASQPSTGPSLTQSRLGAPVPERPNEDHHLRELPPSTPTRTPPSSPPNEPISTVDLSRLSQPQLGTVPEVGLTESMYDASKIGYSAPSASQLARLNSRSGRPPSHILADSSRRGSGAFSAQQHGAMNNQNSILRRIPTVSTQPWVDSPQYHGVYSPATMTNTSQPSAYSPVAPPVVNMQPRYGNHGLVRPSPPSTPNLRPRMTRLETIHSVASQGESGTYVRSANIMRRSSRAERSAALNIQQAKRRGWGGTKKEKKKKDRDGASSAGWTDATRDSFDDNTEKRKGTKCLVM